ncbi:MAG: 2-succinyl-5-enolpyruvyl-6-hydroxy-3-cyclohexene-1-carboxylic-acid synthase [Chlamydiota bacterium]|nr:2-succinyl-5-enolpyruvyl-6-hydroxy-3-cyclohexene-1-carboxylic-acid synthase [Chlamydiota bacterium]
MMKIAHIPNLNYLWSHLMIEELVRLGVGMFCIAPGSRSAPLAIAVAENPKAVNRVHFDERGLAFFALGHTAAKTVPSVLICTSGTAAANFLPAVIEASKKKLPLIVLTADRPPELRKTGANQTIDQVHLYGHYVRFFFDMPCPSKDIRPEMVLTTVDQAFYQAIANQGPVHINCMLREPLTPVKIPGSLTNYCKTLEHWFHKKSPYTQYKRSNKILFPHDLQQYATILQSIKNGIIVTGKLHNSIERKQVVKIAEKLGWPILPDISSGLRLGIDHPLLIHHHHHLLATTKICDKVTGVLHLGGRITSKHWYALIDKIRPHTYLSVLNHSLRNDPLHCVSHRIETSVSGFCSAVSPMLTQRKPSVLARQLKRLSNRTTLNIKGLMDKNAPLNSPAIAWALTRETPSSSALFLASSMSVRLMDIYGYPNASELAIGSNRGASGIDGTVASAVGFAQGIKKTTTLLTGDLALLHDLNSLALAGASKVPLIIVVLNDHGGGIFSHLPISQFDHVFEKYFVTPHGFNFEKVSAMFDLAYVCPNNIHEFINVYKSRLQKRQSTLIEISINREKDFKFQNKITRVQ